MDLVRVQIDSNLSVSRQTLEQLTKLKNLKKPNAEIKSAVAIAMVVEFGLASMEKYIDEVQIKEMSTNDKKFLWNIF